MVLQAYAAEAGAERAEEPMEEAGMSDEIIQKAGITYCTYMTTARCLSLFNVCSTDAACFCIYTMSLKKTWTLRFSTMTSHNSTFINEFWQRGSIFNYLLIVDEMFDIG